MSVVDEDPAKWINSSRVCFLVILSSVAGCAENGNAGVSRTTASGSSVASLTVTSSAIPTGGECPDEFTSRGTGSSPPVEWTGAPAGTKSFAISLWRFFEDKATSSSWTSSYWLIYNIPADTTKLPKDSQGVGINGFSDSGKKSYYPLKSKLVGVGQYHITVYALSEELKFENDKITRRDFLTSIKDLVLAEGTLDFRYDNSKVATLSKK